MRALYCLLLFISFDIYAAEARVKVKGMVCGFCAQGLSKKFLSESSVGHVNVDLDSKYVTIDFKDKKVLSDEQIKALISDAGFSADQIERQ